MISRIKGVLLHREGSRVEVETRGGLVYEVEVPLTVAERLPSQGSDLELRTVYVVREDSASLFGFLAPEERTLFLRVMEASGVGARLALAMLSTLPARRLARALADKEVTVLTQVPGVGKKKAERIVLELSDKVDDLAATAAVDGRPGTDGAEEAVRALVALGYSHQEADRAVREVLAKGAVDGTDELIRRALAHD